ncbi:hypothetical protein B0H19DRAFT_466315 [Mycena capillaripes]|nr:hypothetical protein B0H19DRAFT_466315 [Mycena capillaripes]
MTDRTTSELELPVELQREIFELAALSRPVTIPQLMLVAWYVNKWVEPLLYRTIVFADPIEGYPAFPTDILLRAIRSKPASFFHDAVRHLNFNYTYDMSDEEVKTIICACSGIVNLIPTIVAAADLFMNLSPLKRLYTHLGALFRGSAHNFAHPIFSLLTHLHLWGDRHLHEVDAWAGLATLRHLTHLCLDSDRTSPVLHHLLNTSHSLQIFVLLTPCTPNWEDPEVKDEPSIQDVRFVIMACSDYHADWQRGVHSGQDFWFRAEQFVAQRRLGTIKQWFMETDESTDE